MSTQILEIQPKELKFVFELNKQSQCSIQLTNKTDRHVAFKIKTTSPKKYSVRPNVGVILPKSSCEFTVTMQAPRSAPLDMDCRDKFLIQSTTVPSWTTNEDITASMFSRDDGKYTEEKKLRVTLVSPANSPKLSPIKVDLKQGPGNEASLSRNQFFGGVEILPRQNMVTMDVNSPTVNSQDSKPSRETQLKPATYVELKRTTDEQFKPTKDVESKPTEELKPTPRDELKPEKHVELKLATDEQIKPAKDVELKPLNAAELKLAKDVELNAAKIVEELELVKDIQDMKSKLNELELKLTQAGGTIVKLTEERNSCIQERRLLQEQLAQLSKRGVSVKTIQVGFPLLFVCMVALIGIALGYTLHF